MSLFNKVDLPVECLGMKFSNDAERRKFFTEKLRKKLGEANFRATEGFPLADDETILQLSDPPYYTACPNPFIELLVKDRKGGQDTYAVSPYIGDLKAGDRHPVYSFHPYHTKVPPEVIKTLIEHYTKPGEIVLDAFSGSGMTGVAAEEAGRDAILIDLSPIATFITGVNTKPHQMDQAHELLEAIIFESKKQLGWLYVTEEEGKQTEVNYYVWCDVFTCPECVTEFPFFPHGVIHHGDKVETRKHFSCPSCSAELTVRKIERQMTAEGKKRAMVWVNAGSGRSRLNRQPNNSDFNILGKIQRISETSWYPTDKVNPSGYTAKLAQLGDKGLTDVSRFLSERNKVIFADLWGRISKIEDASLRNLCRACLTSVYTVVSERQGYFGGGGGMSGNLYMPIVRMEKNIYDSLERKLKKMMQAEAAKQSNNRRCMVSTQSATHMSQIADQTVDYIYTDPPFGANIIYSEMNLLLEAWLCVKSNEAPEAVINASNNKDFFAYGKLMQAVFKEYFRVLKPGRWMTVEFHNTMASVWNLIQTSLSEAGFVIAQVGKLDKGSTTILADIRPGAVVQDLVISVYKPTGKVLAEMTSTASAVGTVWEFISSHLERLPMPVSNNGVLEYVVERKTRILYDRMVAFYLSSCAPVPLSAAEFNEGLASRFPEYDDMVFSSSQVDKYLALRSKAASVGQMLVFVEDERSAIDWLRSELKKKPMSYQDISPEFMQQINASWKKWETKPELEQLLKQNFICYDGVGPLPDQIFDYFKRNYPALRSLRTDSTVLIEKGTGLWYVPDLRKSLDVEEMRAKKLLDEFWSYLPAGYKPAALSSDGPSLLSGNSGLGVIRGKQLKEFRTEAIKAGFKFCYQKKDYQTILAVAARLPEELLAEDDELLRWRDTAVTRSSNA